MLKNVKEVKEVKTVTSELVPVVSKQKSFYFKAKVIEDKAANSITLYSFDVKIIEIKGGKFIDVWQGWTRTTGIHIKDFFYQYFDITANKNIFELIQTEKVKSIDELKKYLSGEKQKKKQLKKVPAKKAAKAA